MFQTVPRLLPEVPLILVTAIATATSHLAPQNNQLISERGVLYLKTALRLQRRGEQR
jgi:hypothetical protein